MSLGRPKEDSDLLEGTMHVALIAESVCFVLHLGLIIYYIFIKIKIGGLIRSECCNCNNIFLWFVMVILLTGFLSSLFQGIENYMVSDCGVQWLQYVEFTLYSLHRSITFLVCLERLCLLNNTEFEVSKWWIRSILIMIVIYCIGTCLLLSLEYSIDYVDINWIWYEKVKRIINGNNNNNNKICAWHFSHSSLLIVRISEIIISFLLNGIYLQRLKTLKNNVDSTDDPNQSQIIKKSFKKITYLTTITLLTTIIVGIGYIAFKPFTVGYSIDIFINSFCVFFMFKLNNYQENNNQCDCIGNCQCFHNLSQCEIRLREYNINRGHRRVGTNTSEIETQTQTQAQTH